MKKRNALFATLGLLALAFATKYMTTMPKTKSWQSSMTDYFTCRDCLHMYETELRGTGEVNICKYCTEELA